MTFEDDVLLGEKKDYTMPADDVWSEAYTSFIMQVLDDIKRLTAYDRDEIRISIKGRSWMDVRSVRIYRDKRLGRTDLFRTEIHVRQKGGRLKAYVYTGDREDTLSGVGEFLQVGSSPWDSGGLISKDKADAEYGILKDEAEKQRLSAIISNYMNGNVGDGSLFPEFWQALDRIMDYDPDIGYSKEIVGELWEKDFAKILEFAKRYPYDPVFAKAAGDIALNGYIGPADAKKAYECYMFASDRGYLAGRLALAEMYRDGVYV
ncbi:MAG: hypothetical protein LUD50_00900, partial [Clostridia bacterium]|nr:hypothetical protein [Clostridia bacterium]